MLTALVFVVLNVASAIDKIPFGSFPFKSVREVGVGTQLPTCGTGPVCNCGSGCAASGGTCTCSSCGTGSSCNTCRCCLPGPPKEWADAAARSDLLWTANDTAVTSSLTATIGNGYLAWQFGQQSMFIAGVFMGAAADGVGPGRPVSRRAGIWSPLNMKLKDFSVSHGGLDLRGAKFMRRYTRTSGHGAGSETVEQRWYAHRSSKFKGLMVMQLESLGDAIDIELMGALNPLQNYSTGQISFTTRQAAIRLADGSTSNVTILNGSTRLAESPTTRCTTIALVVTQPPTGSFTLTGTRHLIASFATSLESEQPEQDAIAAYAKAMPQAPDALYASHVTEWATIWQSGIEMEGRKDVATAVNSSLYYLLSSIREDTVFSLSPGGLPSNGYNGHTFWDCETWMYPPILMLHPSIAASLLEYRIQRTDAAKQKARSYSPPYNGAMFAWESAVTGLETCPPYAPEGEHEQHISGDIAFAAKQYYAVTKDAQWLRQKGFPLVSAIADFWVSKAAQGTGIDGVSHIQHVIPPDEFHHGDDSVYTNTVAKMSLDFATKASQLVGEGPKPAWANTSSRVPILFDEARQYHPEFLGYTYGTPIKQADVVLLSYPLGVNMTTEVRNNDLAAYENATSADGPAMTWGMHAVGHLESDSPLKAATNFNRSFANVQQPYAIWTETPTGGTTNFLTGAGGFLQTVLYGYTGLRINDDSLRLRPKLIEGTTAIRVRGAHYQGYTFDYRYNDHQLRLLVTEVDAGVSCALCIGSEHSSGSDCLHVAGESAVFPLSSNALTFAINCQPTMVEVMAKQ